MKIIFKEPRTGKTTELIKRCAILGGYIVCKDKRNADYIIEMATELGAKIPYPITFDEFLSKRYYGKGVDRFYIDNADMLLQKIAGNVRIESIVIDDTSKWDEQYNGEKQLKEMLK